jgi:hypothetical protein
LEEYPKSKDLLRRRNFPETPAKPAKSNNPIKLEGSGTSANPERGKLALRAIRELQKIKSPKTHRLKPGGYTDKACPELGRRACLSPRKSKTWMIYFFELPYYLIRIFFDCQTLKLKNPTPDRIPRHPIIKRVNGIIPPIVENSGSSAIASDGNQA